MIKTEQTIGVIGAGAWGTALAQVLSNAGRDVLIQAREEEVVEAINSGHENTVYLPGIPLNEKLKATQSLHEASARDILLMVTPSQHLRATLSSIRDEITPDKPLVICSKGIELKTGHLLSQVVEEVVPEACTAVLTGPTFASEIAAGLPGAVTIGVKDKVVGHLLQDVLGTKYFRPYITDDVIGAQIGGAIKNVIAIASGVIHGRKLGESARAALLTRGLAEMGRLAGALGGKKETLMGMCGVGDLVLTASSMQSRNFSLGAALGEGRSPEDILGPRKAVTEGVHTAKSTANLAEKLGVDMPITVAVNKCLNEDIPLDAMIEDMLNRPFKDEEL